MLANVQKAPSAFAVPELLSHAGPIFADLTLPQQRAVRTIQAEMRVCDRDMQMVRAEESPSGVLLIQSGWAFRYRLLADGRRQILNLLLPGDTAGFDTLLSGMPGTAIQAATSVRYLAFNREQIKRLLSEESWFRQRAMEALMDDRRQIEIAVVRLGQCNAEERIVAVLLDIHARLARQKLTCNGSFTMGLTQSHLADLVGLTPVHLGRVLQRLRARRMLSVNGRNVTLLDIQALERMAPS